MSFYPTEFANERDLMNAAKVFIDENEIQPGTSFLLGQYIITYTEDLVIKYAEKQDAISPMTTPLLDREYLFRINSCLPKGYNIDEGKYPAMAFCDVIENPKFHGTHKYSLMDCVAYVTTSYFVNFALGYALKCGSFHSDISPICIFDQNRINIIVYFDYNNGIKMSDVLQTSCLSAVQHSANIDPKTKLPINRILYKSLAAPVWEFIVDIPYIRKANEIDPLRFSEMADNIYMVYIKDMMKFIEQEVFAGCSEQTPKDNSYLLNTMFYIEYSNYGLHIQGAAVPRFINLDGTLIKYVYLNDGKFGLESDALHNFAYDAGLVNIPRMIMKEIEQMYSSFDCQVYAKYVKTDGDMWLGDTRYAIYDHSTTIYSPMMHPSNFKLNDKNDPMKNVSVVNGSDRYRIDTNLNVFTDTLEYLNTDAIIWKLNTPDVNKIQSGAILMHGYVEVPIHDSNGTLYLPKMRNETFYEHLRTLVRKNFEINPMQLDKNLIISIAYLDTDICRFQVTEVKLDSEEDEDKTDKSDLITKHEDNQSKILPSTKEDTDSLGFFPRMLKKHIEKMASSYTENDADKRKKK